MSDPLALVERALDLICAIPHDSLPTPTKAEAWENVASTLQIARTAALERSGAIWQEIEQKHLAKGLRRCSGCFEWFPGETLILHTTGYGPELKPEMEKALLTAQAKPVDRGNRYAYCPACERKHG
jgi:hypothetical protein